MSERHPRRGRTSGGDPVAGKQRPPAILPSSGSGEGEVETPPAEFRAVAPAWQELALKWRGEEGPIPGIELWKARLYGSIQDWAQWGGVTEESVRQQGAIVEALLSLGEGVLDELAADLLAAMGAASDADNSQFFLICLLSSSVQRAGGRPQVRLGLKPARAKDSLAAWTWRTLVKPWLPTDRRRLDMPYRFEDANVWAGALCWVLALTGQASSIEEGLQGQQAALRVFARAVARVAGGHLITRREVPPWGAEEVAASRLRPDSFIRNNAAVRLALHRAYVRLGGAADDATGREAILVRLAVFLTAVRPFYWPPAIRRRPRGGKHRAFKVEINRLRRQLGLRGVPRQQTR